MNHNKRALSPGIDTAAIRLAAKHLDDGPLTAGYQADREALVNMPSNALATEPVCVLRYKRHYYTATGLQNGPIKANPTPLPVSCSWKLWRRKRSMPTICAIC